MAEALVALIVLLGAAELAESDRMEVQEHMDLQETVDLVLQVQSHRVILEEEPFQVAVAEALDTLELELDQADQAEADLEKM